MLNPWEVRVAHASGKRKRGSASDSCRRRGWLGLSAPESILGRSLEGAGHPSQGVWVGDGGGSTFLSVQQPCDRRWDVPGAPFYSMCQAILGVRGHRMFVDVVVPDPSHRL